MDVYFILQKLPDASALLLHTSGCMRSAAGGVDSLFHPAEFILSRDL